VNELFEGQTFGELALITEKPLMATINTKRHGFSLGIVTKKDNQSLYGENFKTKMDSAFK
jgi:hypothetical protein